MKIDVGLTLKLNWLEISLGCCFIRFLTLVFPTGWHFEEQSRKRC